MGTTPLAGQPPRGRSGSARDRRHRDLGSSGCSRLLRDNRCRRRRPCYRPGSYRNGGAVRDTHESRLTRAVRQDAHRRVGHSWLRRDTHRGLGPPEWVSRVGRDVSATAARAGSRRLPPPPHRVSGRSRTSSRHTRISSHKARRPSTTHAGIDGSISTVAVARAHTRPQPADSDTVGARRRDLASRVALEPVRKLGR